LYFYYLGSTKLNNIIQNWSEQTLKCSPPSLKGSWNRERQIGYANKVDIPTLQLWFQKQDVTFSHFSRKLNKKSCYYFETIRSLIDLYTKYKGNYQ